MEQISIGSKKSIHLSFAQLHSIRRNFLEGVPIKKIARNHNIGIVRLERAFIEVSSPKESALLIRSLNKIGHRNEPYYSEEELLTGIPNYTWESLSRTEKQFYNNYGSKRKQFKSGRRN
jgi:hypothetical protein